MDRNQPIAVNCCLVSELHHYSSDIVLAIGSKQMTSVLQLSKRLSETPQVIDAELFKVRPFSPRDVDSWLELRHRAFARETHGVRTWSRADFEAEFCQRWWWDPAKMWLAEAKTPTAFPHLAGSVSLAMRGSPENAKPVVHWLMVAPVARRHGIARLLMSHLEAAAWNAGYLEIWLETHAAWNAAARFYEALGYAPASDSISDQEK
jgi:GNAT superfamily N-acetyltransferase